MNFFEQIKHNYEMNKMIAKHYNYRYISPLKMMVMVLTGFLIGAAFELGFNLLIEWIFK